MTFKQICPVYINTFNIFRPLNTWFYNVKNHWHTTSHKFKIKVSIKKRDFEWLRENFYTWYWWDHPHIWNFEKKLAIFIFEDVQYKYKMDIRELETCPFALIRIFNWNLLITLNKNDYEYWESQYSK